MEPQPSQSRLNLRVASLFDVTVHAPGRGDVEAKTFYEGLVTAEDEAAGTAEVTFDDGEKCTITVRSSSVS